MLQFLDLRSEMEAHVRQHRLEALRQRWVRAGGLLRETERCSTTMIIAHCQLKTFDRQLFMLQKIGSHISA